MKLFIPRILITAFATAALTLTVQAQYQYKETTLYTFGGQKDVYQPVRNLLADQQGNFYGASTYGGGGCSGKGCGTVFELSPGSGGGWTETILYAFTGKDDGEYPIGNILMDANGNIFGTTGFGGTSGAGVAWELSPSATGWTQTVLYTFTGQADGGFPSGLTFDANGNLFGTATQGGANTWGAIFELSPGSSGWTESVLYSFTDGNDGGEPYGGVAIDANGRLYGAAEVGGSTTSCQQGCGTVYRLSPSSTGWRFSRLYAFQGPGGETPFGGLALDAAGNVYGTTRAGGHNYGVVFELSPTSSGGWKETLLHDFTNGTDGADPSNSVMFDSEGNLYGATDGTASNAPNTIFRLRPGTGGGVFSVIYTFPSANTGTAAQTPSVFDSAGNLYGVALTAGRAQGSVYELTPPSKGTTN
jgi:uncharacterized repeat protein (TIGR03803 family)